MKKARPKLHTAKEKIADVGKGVAKTGKAFAFAAVLTLVLMTTACGRDRTPEPTDEMIARVAAEVIDKAFADRGVELTETGREMFERDLLRRKEILQRSWFPVHGEAFVIDQIEYFVDDWLDISQNDQRYRVDTVEVEAEEPWVERFREWLKNSTWGMEFDTGEGEVVPHRIHNWVTMTIMQFLVDNGVEVRFENVFEDYALEVLDMVMFHIERNGVNVMEIIDNTKWSDSPQALDDIVFAVVVEQTERRIRELARTHGIVLEGENDLVQEQ